jgi:hypothetical protein
MGSIIKHMAVNIEGLLQHHKGRKITIMMDNKGVIMSDKAARLELARLQQLGHTLLPTADCEGFDPFKNGCPGHRKDEADND